MAIKIYIDQGHNPKNPNAGAEGNGLREQDLVYPIGVELAARLNANPDFEARLSRPTPDTQIGTSNSTSLRLRVQEANAWGADYFISIHTNGSTNPTANGTEGYVYSRTGEAYNLALDIVNAICNRMGTVNRGVFSRPSLYVLRRTNMPATLIELAFISNYEDSQKMKNDPYGFAFAIYQGILRFFGVN